MFRLLTHVPSYLLCSLLLLAGAVSASAQGVFINEIHYDNVGTDSGEAIEVAGPAGTNLSGWSLVLYNGNPTQRTAYNTLNLNGIIPDQLNGFGTLSFAAVGLQNGGSGASSEPDGIVLFNGTSVIQFLCYEGTFVASGGVANGQTCSNIGVADDSPVPAAGTSLRLGGTGTTYTDFVWNGAAAASFGSVNTGQTFTGAPTASATISPTVGAAGTNVPVTITGTNTHFVQGTTTVTLSGTGVSVGALAVTSATSLSTTFAIDGGAALGSRTVTVTTGAEAPAVTFSVIGLTTIHEIQGSGNSSPLVGQTVTIEGVVVGDFEGNSRLGGFFVQEEDLDVDADPATSEGIFVFNNGPNAVAAGDKVRLTGTVAEAFGQTRLNSPSGLAVLASGLTVTPATITFPLASPTFLERYEGMAIRIDQPLTVTEVFNHARFGELLLSQGGRLFTPTNIVLPGAAAIAQQTDNNLRAILLDDGRNTQNPDPVDYPEGGLSANSTARVGEIVNNTTDGQNPILGVLGYDFGRYRIQPTTALTFLNPTDNPRPVAPSTVGGNVRAAFANVLNYFTTLDTGAPICGPSGGLDCRGANDSTEFDRQRDKIVQGLLALDPHVLGISEMENNFLTSVQDLVGALNVAANTPGKFAFVGGGATIGTDAIRSAIIYQPAVVNPVGNPAVLTNAIDPRTLDNRSRPPLAQTFERIGPRANLQRFTVVVNHFKSKGSSCATDTVGGALDVDAGDGQGNCNRTRISTAQALLDWLATNPTSDPTPVASRKVLILGDLNAYALEDPIQALTSPLFTKAGLTSGNPNAVYKNLIRQYVGPNAYSYVFDGQSGYLDHALANPVLETLVTGVTEFHVNADEPRAVDYNTEFKSAGQVTSFYDSNLYRFSDHDPVLVGFNPLCGDLDDDGDVDAVDGNLLRSKLGQPVQNPIRRFDMDRDNTISLRDYSRWFSCQRQYAAAPAN